jgi:meiotic recombination protein DMC1
VAVLITNQMTADPGATMSFQADPKKPIGKQCPYLLTPMIFSFKKMKFSLSYLLTDA